MDPEGAKVALTADFPSITIVGNGANQVFPDQAYLDEVYEVDNAYTKLFHDHYGTIVCISNQLSSSEALLIPSSVPFLG